MTTSSKQQLSNIPTALSSFVGRGREISESHQLLGATRILTLTGPGGCGKTRLALRLASAVLAEFDDGVWLTEFGPLADARLVPQAVAVVLGAREQPGRSLTETISSHLEGRQVLLIFDNCEHLVAACAQLAEALLQGCPNLRILATSRETLNLAGESVWVVPPLSLPDPQPWRSPTSAQQALATYHQSEAVRLFVDRARAASPTFALTVDNGLWVAEICRRLDGMPLAIELAAARVRALTVRQIAERLDDRFRLLTGGSRTAPARHQSLEATLDWSYSLLPEAEQRTLQRLSVFAGGWSLPAAEALCAGDGVAPNDVLDLLTHLVDKSLVVADKQGDEMRYRMLETIREFAGEQLLGSGLAAVVRRRHAEYFLALAQQAVRTDSKLYWPEQPTTVSRLEAEHDNLRAVLAWSQANSGGQELGLRLAAALAQFWQMRGYVSEGLAWLQAFLASGGASAAARAEGLLLAGYLHIYSNDIARAVAFLEQGLALYRELGDAGGVAWQMVWLGWAAVAQGDYLRAATLGEQAYVALQEVADQHGAGVALFPRGEAAFLQGDLVQAAAFYQESLALLRGIGNFWAAGRRLTRLGQIAYRQGNPQQGVTFILEGMADCAVGGDYSGAAMALAALAGVARAMGEPERAVRLLGAVVRLQENTGAPLWYVDRVDLERNVADLRAQVGQTDFAEWWAEGQALSLPQAMAYASEPITGRDTAARPAARDFGGLTARERQVAALIAQGQSNRKIAEALVVSPKTVETYVTRILGKLGFDSRVQIATWATEKSLSAAPKMPDS